ncbi:MAG TPA: hypothetical protein VH370_22240 [Humisphaera sp.]|jgi:hypothetical protein|nr:hypothetical protein [Humisphaera sp.]
MRHIPTLQTTERALRARVCAICPNRTPGEAVHPDLPLTCEADCPLFAALPQLRQTALNLDPMVGHYKPAMHKAIQRAQTLHGVHVHECFDPLHGHTPRVIHLLGELTGHR